MRAVIQRVSRAKVDVDGGTIGQINSGLLILLAVNQDDNNDVIKKMGDKILNLRIFSDQNDKMNLSIKDVSGEMLVVPQFTLYGDAKKGNRPNFFQSAEPDKANNFYEKLIQYLSSSGLKVEAGQFKADMQVELVNNGPVTIIIDQ